VNLSQILNSGENTTFFKRLTLLVGIIWKMETVLSTKMQPFGDLTHKENSQLFHSLMVGTWVMKRYGNIAHF
jgi:hypothetical protein